jgi:hypothetical protein
VELSDVAGVGRIGEEEKVFTPAIVYAPVSPTNAPGPPIGIIVVAEPPLPPVPLP